MALKRRKQCAERERFREKSCAGKRRYETRKAALTGLVRLLIDRDCPNLMRTYRCRFCRGFHFGHTIEAAPGPFIPGLHPAARKAGCGDPLHPGRTTAPQPIP